MEHPFAFGAVTGVASTAASFAFAFAAVEDQPFATASTSSVEGASTPAFTLEFVVAGYQPIHLPRPPFNLNTFIY